MHVLNPGLLGSARSSGNASPSRSSATATRPRPTGCVGSTGPFVLRRLKTDKTIIDDLPDKIETDRALPADPRAGDAVPGGRRRPARAGRRGRGHPAARARAGRPDEAEAGVQPSGPLPGRRLRLCRPFRQARPGPRSCSTRSWPRATRSCASRSSPSGGTCSCRTSSADSASSRLWLHGRVRRPARDEMVAGSGAGRAARVPRLAEGGWHRVSTSPPRRTSSTSTAGGTRPSRTRRPTAPSGSASTATCWSTSWSAPARSRSASTR